MYCISSKLTPGYIIKHQKQYTDYETNFMVNSHKNSSTQEPVTPSMPIVANWLMAT